MNECTKSIYRLLNSLSALPGVVLLLLPIVVARTPLGRGHSITGTHYLKKYIKLDVMTKHCYNYASNSSNNNCLKEQ